MYRSSIFLSLLAMPFAVMAINGQVNFYYDTACKDYAGSAYPSPASSAGAGNVVGGPFGSKSMLWVNAESGSGCNGAFPLFCKNEDCSASEVAHIGECKHFKNGVWAEYWETCGGE